MNIDDDKDPNTRTTKGTDPNGKGIEMTNVNVHEGESNNGNYNSRGSQGCLTIHPGDAKNFFSNFNCSGTNGVTGNTKGTVTIYRGGGTSMKKYLDIMQKVQNIIPTVKINKVPLRN